MNGKAHICCGQKTWLEGPAVEQFNRVLQLPGIVRGAAFPDLHPGRGIPVGAAFLSQDLIYPALIGNDIGCGMTLFSTGMPLRKFKKDKLLRRLGNEPEIALRETALAESDTGIADPDNMLGTLGHGNHFAEFLSVERVLDSKVCETLSLGKGDILLLIHSGSRAYGETLWRNFSANHGDHGVTADSMDGAAYLKQHAELIAWASFNRRLIARALARMAGCPLAEILNSTHNSITPYGNRQFIHRKGASTAEPGKPLIVAGSRGAFSYLVKPVGSGEENLFSLAHGAGRKWNRQSTHARLRAKYDNAQMLQKTRLGTAVICPDKNLLYEEAPEAYKNIADIIADLQSFQLASAAAELRPIVNIKP